MDNIIFDGMIEDASFCEIAEEGLIMKAEHGKAPSIKLSKDGFAKNYEFKVIKGKLVIETEEGLKEDQRYLTTVKKIHPYIRKYTPHMLNMLLKITDVVMKNSEEAFTVAFNDKLSKKERIQRVRDLVADCNIATEKIVRDSDAYLNKEYKKYENDRDQSLRYEDMTAADRTMILKFMQNRKKIYERLNQMITKYNTEYTKEPVLFSKAKVPAKIAMVMMINLMNIESFLLRYIASHTSV